MAINPLKAFLFAGGGVVAVAGTAYVAGAFDPLLAPQPPAQVAALPAAQQPADTVTTPATGSRLPAASATTPNAAESPAAAASPTAEKAPPSTATAAAQAVLPTFDVVRVEGNGSLVIAGNAAAKAKVEALNGATVLGATDAGPDGAFAIVPDTPLKPGDYQITLHATAPDGTVAASTQTAVVSVPEKPDGQVLAMVEEPGKPAELMAVPKPDDKPTAAAAQPSGAAPAETKPAATASAPAGETETAAASAQPAESPAQADAKPAEAKPGAAVAPAAKVVVEAVEIDGAKVFVAGIADAGRKVRAYANEILLGDAITSPDGHFLVEAKRDLPVGTYTVRVDALDADGAKVVARATVPFEREPGQAIAAVAPASAKPEAQSAAQPSAEASSTELAKQAPGTQPAAPEKPAEVAAATPPADGVPETVSPKLEHADSAVIIRRKDTLWRISRRVYGHGTRYSTIYLANQDQISDPDKIWPGQVFKLPEKSREGEAADMTVLGDQMTTAPAKTE